MGSKITRRQTVAVLLAPAPLLVPAPAMAQAAAETPDPLQQQHERLESNYNQLGDIELGPNDQPAFVFKP